MISFRKRDSCFVLQNVLFGLFQPDDQLALWANSLGPSGLCVNLTTDLYRVSNLGMLLSLFFYRRKFQSDTPSYTSYSFLLSLWSSGQSFWLQIQRSRVRFPALPDFLSGSGSGTGYTQTREPREVN